MVRMFQACCDITTSTPASSQAEALKKTEQRVRRIVDDEKSAPGIQHLIVDAEHIVSAVCHGVLDIEQEHEPVQPHTRFMAYSTTKIITAIDILQLIERGRMKLDAPLTTYLQDQPYGDHVTIRMLLNHTSGIPNPIPSDWFVTEEDQASLDRDMALAKMLRDHPNLNFEPGSKYGYSNIAYWLLEKAHETVSGQSFVDYIQEHIFRPLSIQPGDASFLLSAPHHRDLATGHIQKYSFSNVIFYLISPSAYWLEPAHGWSRFARMHHLGFGYGGLYCSARAFGTILQDLLQEKSGILLKPETKELFFSPQETTCGETIQGTLGWIIGKLNGVPYYSKPGGGFGFHGNVRIYPTLGVATVFFANSTEISPGPIHARSDALDAPYVSWKKAASSVLL